MIGRATITLGTGPHSSYRIPYMYKVLSCTLFEGTKEAPERTITVIACHSSNSIGHINNVTPYVGPVSSLLG